MTEQKSRGRKRPLKQKSNGPGHVCRRVSFPIRRLSKSWQVQLITLVLTLFPLCHALRIDVKPRLRIQTLARYSAPGRIQAISSKQKESKAVDLAIYVVVVNASAAQVEIASCLVEGLVGGHWRALKRISLTDPFQLICYDAAQKAVVYDLTTDFFETAARARVIQPGCSLSGWLIFRWSCDSEENVQFDQLRLVVQDTEGYKVEVPMLRVVESFADNLLKPKPVSPVKSEPEFSVPNKRQATKRKE